jgi:hypothetical protein
MDPQPSSDAEAAPACLGGGPGAPGPRAEPAGPALWALSGLTATPGECADGVAGEDGALCASKPAVRAIVAFAGELEGGPAEPPPLPAALLPAGTSAGAAAIRRAAGRLGCASESCVLAHPAVRQFAAARGAAAALAGDLGARYKAAGPRTGAALLSNFHIDGTLARWAVRFPEFFPCPFAMMDFERNGDLFGRIDLADVLGGRVAADLGPGRGCVQRPFACFGCVLNTDVSSGPGKHWVAVFVDARAGAGEAFTVEYFNSTGQPPPQPVIRWSERARGQLERFRAEQGGRGGPVLVVPPSRVEHQRSDTECGLYSLFYIRCRLEGRPPAFFAARRIPDAAMSAFRRYCFRAA